MNNSLLIGGLHECRKVVHIGRVSGLCDCGSSNYANGRWRCSQQVYLERLEGRGNCKTLRVLVSEVERHVGCRCAVSPGCYLVCFQAPGVAHILPGSHAPLTERVEMQEARVGTLATILYPLVRSFYTEQQWLGFLLNLQSLSLKHRKQLITVCRSCSIPHPDTTLHSRCLEILRILEEPKWLFSSLQELLTNPLLSGLIIALCISLPLSDEAVRQTYNDLLAKEMLVMESTPLPSIINYNPFFGDYMESIHPSVTPNPRMAAMVHQLIDKWVLSLESKEYILPHMTSKLCSKATQEEVRDKYPDYSTFEEEGATQPDLEWLYMHYDDKLDGVPCEVKQRWYTSGVTPRTYYAAGSEAYHKSKYVRDALNSLCDFLPPTERYARVNPHRIVLSSAQSHAVIYDLSSFTSNMHEQRHFMSRLSMYCKGHIVRIFDSIEGVIEADLGDLLSTYNDLNTEPLYHSDKLIGKGVVLTHHVAGFLGVYGNLASCTFLHGAVVSQLVSSLSQVGVAGDDGIVESEDDYTTFFVIRLLGLMEESKCYNTTEIGNQVYLKRPIRQIGYRVFSESFALYSMLEHLFDEDDRRFFQSPRSKIERKGSLASSIVAYLRSLTRILLSSEEKEMVYSFLTSVYDHSGLPIEGSVPQIHTVHNPGQQKVPSGIVPVVSLDCIGEDPIEFTIKSLYTGVAVLPERSQTAIDLDFGMLYVGSEFVCTGSPLLAYYRKLGFVELEQSDVIMTGEVGLSALLRHYSPARSFPVYTVNVLRDIPTHLHP